MFKNYIKSAVQPMRPYVPNEDMTGISLSVPDSELPTLDGGMIAVNPGDTTDQWYVAKKFFDDNYILAE